MRELPFFCWHQRPFLSRVKREEGICGMGVTIYFKDGNGQGEGKEPGASGMLPDNLEHGWNLSGDPRAIRLAAYLTGQDDSEGETDNPLVIHAVVQAIYPGLAGYRMAQNVGLLSWSD